MARRPLSPKSTDEGQPCSIPRSRFLLRQANESRCSCADDESSAFVPIPSKRLGDRKLALPRSRGHHNHFPPHVAANPAVVTGDKSDLRACPTTRRAACRCCRVIQRDHVNDTRIGRAAMPEDSAWRSRILPWSSMRPSGARPAPLILTRQSCSGPSSSLNASTVTLRECGRADLAPERCHSSVSSRFRHRPRSHVHRWSRRPATRERNERLREDGHRGPRQRQHHQRF